MIALKINVPGGEDEVGKELEAGPSVGPLPRFRARGLRAEAARVGLDADPPEVEPIGVPTGLDRDVRVRQFVSMPLAGPAEQAECTLLQLEERTAELRRQLRPRGP